MSSNDDTTAAVLRDAQILASFANLEPAGVDYFRNNFPDFLPPVWWKFEVVQGGVGDPPDENCSQEEYEAYTAALSRNSRPLWEDRQKSVRLAWKNGFEMKTAVRLIAVGAVPWSLGPTLPGTVDVMGLKVWPYMNAVFFLAGQSWRARFCSMCGNHFVADKTNRKFCSDRCFQQSRKKDKLGWWQEHGQQWRAEKSNKKRSKKKRTRASTARK